MRILAGTDVQQESQALAMQARSAGLLLQKPKQIQAADWSVRPLRDEQVIYAATDAQVLLHLFDCQNSEASLTGSLSSSSRPSLQVPRFNRRVAVEYTAIFLSPDSRAKLLRRVPPRFSTVLADHMTLTWQPETVAGLAVGSQIKLRVVGIGYNEKVQAVSVETLEPQPRSGHVTISHRPESAAAEANDLTFISLDEYSTLEGVLGVSITQGGVDREQLSQQLLAKLDDLVDDGQPGRSERFEGLTDGERYALHLAADELGLEHRSEGKKDGLHRKLILTIPKRWRRPDTSQADVKKCVIKDAKRFASVFGCIPGQRLHGRLGRGGVINWEPGVDVHPALLSLLTGQRPDARIAIILRGFPGSGKSSLSGILRRSGADVASADDFFVNVEKLPEAHEQCRQHFMKAIAQGCPIVVDNTNIRKADYAFYRSKAEGEGYTVVILEFLCSSTAELERMRKRSVHGVPGGAVGAMWSRWETDPAAYRLQPYLPQELLPWLRAQGMLGRQASANTHLVMPNGPFLSVPSSARDEFFERFEAEWGCHPISELGKPQAFKLFFDIDGLNIERLVLALPKLKELCGGPIFVTGTAEPPAPGYHLFIPSRIVKSEEALALRKQWIEAEETLEQYVDAQLYTNPQLRLLGSRKVTKDATDVGRVHDFMGCFDEHWCTGPHNWKWSDVSIQV
eukprot:TRINITY_DN6598_c0_g1_i2.p1 TRINITY_DN6598_c0_g1~~TRINITY_DN6598_c0_g1_i2.p1  ORF type:complete len:681 (-),score=110.34 TRINITY_DN6598_c0_g1_i2:140-2182(-)